MSVEQRKASWSKMSYQKLIEMCDPTNLRGSELDFVEEHPGLTLANAGELSEEEAHRVTNFALRSCVLDVVPGRPSVMNYWERQLIFHTIPTLTEGKLKKIELPADEYAQFFKDLLKGKYPSIEYRFHRRRKNKSGPSIESVSPGIDVLGLPMQDIILEASKLGVYIKIGGLQTVDIETTGRFRKSRIESYGILHKLHAYQFSGPKDMALPQAVVLLKSLQEPMIDQIPNLIVHFFINGTLLFKNKGHGISIS